MRHTCRLGNPCAILVIEDDPIIVHMLQASVNQFEPGCFIIEVATTAREAVSKLQGIKYDAITLDFNLPDSIGIATLQALKNLFEDLPPVVVLTGANDAETELQAFEEGASEYITKPFDGQQFLKRIRHSILRRRRLNIDRKELLEEVEIFRKVAKEIDGESQTLLREAAEDVLRIAVGMTKHN